VTSFIKVGLAVLILIAAVVFVASISFKPYVELLSYTLVRVVGFAVLMAICVAPIFLLGRRQRWRLSTTAVLWLLLTTIGFLAVHQPTIDGSYRSERSEQGLGAGQQILRLQLDLCRANPSSAGCASTSEPSPSN
jgi:hypothetical protein